MASTASGKGAPPEHSAGAADSLQTPPPPSEAAAEEEHAELTTFQCRDAYVYRIPPASTIGHRAELWRVDDWDAVSLLYSICFPAAPELPSPVAAENRLRMLPFRL